MIKAIFILTGLTLIPLLELRASIPIGFFSMSQKISWPIVSLVCILANMVLGWIVYGIMGPVFIFIRRWRWFDQKIWPILEKTRHKIHPYVEKYGELGVAVFIGIPLPGSGVYSGALGAYLLGVDKKKFAIANILGVLIAGCAVTLVSLLILKGAIGENSWISRLFLKM